MPSDIKVLIDEDVHLALAEALRRHGDDPRDVGDLELPGDPAPGEFFKAAQAKQLDVMTDDAALVNAIFDKPIGFNRCIVYLQLEGGDVERDDAVDRLFARYKRLSPGRLYSVTGSRVNGRAQGRPRIARAASRMRAGAT